MQLYRGVRHGLAILVENPPSYGATARKREVHTFELRSSRQINWLPWLVRAPLAVLQRDEAISRGGQRIARGWETRELVASAVVSQHGRQLCLRQPWGRDGDEHTPQRLAVIETKDPAAQDPFARGGYRVSGWQLKGCASTGRPYRGLSGRSRHHQSCGQQTESRSPEPEA
jgi:hypothetical protein